MDSDNYFSNETDVESLMADISVDFDDDALTLPEDDLFDIE